jgi:hypothetical protein
LKPNAIFMPLVGDYFYGRENNSPDVPLFFKLIGTKGAKTIVCVEVPAAVGIWDIYDNGTHLTKTVVAPWEKCRSLPDCGEWRKYTKNGEALRYQYWGHDQVYEFRVDSAPEEPEFKPSKWGPEIYEHWDRKPIDQWSWISEMDGRYGEVRH